ncbi:MAG: arsenosugar biosynthesis radical SAM protein ArsS [Acidobacteriota bacterium]|nr:arsenosugar biosynthesis radical SAM protein ArsS [Acidobacteriota bacterium]
MNFSSTLAQHGKDLRRTSVDTLQINVGKVCNQACQHCHVEAGPKRTESMTRETAERVLELLSNTPNIKIVDITGGAPELNPNFRSLVEESRRLHKKVIDRCNLTILLEPGFENLPHFLAAHDVEVTASLPCYTPENVNKQRGRGVFERSIRALQILNRLGYGRPGSHLNLNLVFNPGGASLPPPQDALELDYKKHLLEKFGIEFHRLLTITNMPIRRFSDFLIRIGKQEQYSNLLRDNFNPATVDHLMCRSLVSISWDGRLYDCDFNQMLEMPIPGSVSVWDLESLQSVIDGPIHVADHCFGCTAGAGSSCGGKLDMRPSSLPDSTPASSGNLIA